MTSSFIIDSDGGVDDILAIMILFASEERDIALINATSGNVGAVQAFKNIVAVLELCDRKIQVSKGRDTSLSGRRKRAREVYGKDGLGNTFLAKAVKVTKPLNAIAAFKKAIEVKGARKILALGPLTNVAVSFLKYPAFFDYLDEIWLMGGTFEAGKNTGRKTEFNFRFDPQAAEIVLSVPVPIRIVPLDVTQEVLFEKSFIENFENRDDTVSRFLLRILNFAYHFKDAKKSPQAARLPDLVTACLFLDEDAADFRRMKVSIDSKRGNVVRSTMGREVLAACNLKKKKILEKTLHNLLSLS